MFVKVNKTLDGQRSVSVSVAEVAVDDKPLVQSASGCDVAASYVAANPQLDKRTQPCISSSIHELYVFVAHRFEQFHVAVQVQVEIGFAVREQRRGQRHAEVQFGGVLKRF